MRIVLGITALSLLACGGLIPDPDVQVTPPSIPASAGIPMEEIGGAAPAGAPAGVCPAEFRESVFHCVFDKHWADDGPGMPGADPVKLDVAASPYNKDCNGPCGFTVCGIQSNPAKLSDLYMVLGSDGAGDQAFKNHRAFGTGTSELTANAGAGDTPTHKVQIGDGRVIVSVPDATHAFAGTWFAQCSNATGTAALGNLTKLTY